MYHSYVLEYLGKGRELQNGSWWEQVEAGSRARCVSLFQVLLKFMLIYGKGRTW
jgi:hypothetical protein